MLTRTLADVWRTPDYFPLRIDPWGDTITFVPLPEESYRKLSFLDDRYVPTGDCWEFSLSEVARTVPRAAHARPLHCVFHVAFCGSTLISRCLDALPATLVLKEPYSLHDLGFMKRHHPLIHEKPREWVRAFDVLVALLGRTHVMGQTAFVKPTDASTHLIGDVLSRSDASATLFLHATLEEFLVSILSDEIRRGFVRERLEDLWTLRSGHPLFQPDHWRRLADAERAACLWFLHTDVYADYVRSHPDARCRSLDFAEFLAAPVDGLRAIADLFGIHCSSADLEAVVRSETAVHSKDRHVQFNMADRTSARRASAETYRDEITAGLAWADRQRARYSLTDVIPKPLAIDRLKA